ncbi:MAG: hypothetical protein GQE15_08350 [Archangiaceae bacterium]|nr:hypothetical protein [Archangiaceae bacterium]
MIRSLLVATVFLAFAAVSSSCGPLVTAGEACTTRADCPPSYSCFQKQTGGTVEVPGGFCSRGCAAEADTHECPSGTVCTYFGDSQLVCSPQCTADSQCRSGYVCADVAMGSTAVGNMGGAKKTCRPKGVTQ